MTMDAMKKILALVGLLWLAGCTLESPTLMTDPTAAGDVIAGFPGQGSFTLESYDRAKRDYATFATARAEAVAGKGIRYLLDFNDNGSMAIVVQARKISPDNYLLRYFQLSAGNAGDLSQSGLVFLRRDGDTYYALTGISSQAILDKIFTGDTPLQLTGSVLRIDTARQAEMISAYFRDHFEAFPQDQDYARFRLAQ